MTIKHLLTGDELSAQQIIDIVDLGMAMKKDKTLHHQFLSGKHIAVVFEKPSLRTRFSFTAAIHQLGGQMIESVSQTRKKEMPKDMIRVIQGYCNAMIIRTHDDSDLTEMSHYSKIPIINALTNFFHPCQILADLMTLKENFNAFNGLKLCYIGDGNNILNSLLLMCTKVGVDIHYCCPRQYAPQSTILQWVKKNNTKGLISSYETPADAIKGCHAVYTDVWVSMGFDPKDKSAFNDFQVNEKLMNYAEKNAVFMHCMPMIRGKEVNHTLPDATCSVIFKQSENRMHVQKSLLTYFVK